MPPKKAKKARVPAVIPTPQRATVLVVFVNRGLTNRWGYGAHYRRLRQLVLEDAEREKIEIVGNGTMGIATPFPLECTLAETGTIIGHLDWEVSRYWIDETTDNCCRALAMAVLTSVRKYLETEYEINAATGKLERPGKNVASGSFIRTAAVEKKKKKAKAKKKN